MSLKEYLSQIIGINRAINAELEELEELKKCRMTSRSFTGGGNSNGKSSVETLVEKIERSENEINAKIDRLIDLKSEITALVEKIGDRDIQSVFKLHYISGKTWECVAEETFFCLRTVHNLHNRGLKELEKHHTA